MPVMTVEVVFPVEVALSPAPIDGVYERPVPGAEMVGRTPRLPKLSVKPFPPTDDEIPDLLRLMRKPFPSGMILRKRKGMSFHPVVFFLWEAGAQKVLKGIPCDCE